jgi:hypothetical protein
MNANDDSTAAGAQQSSVTSSPPAQVSPTSAISNDPLVIALQAQIKEMRRSEDRLHTTVLWSLSTVFALAIGLAVYSGWSSTKVYERDKQALRDDLKKTVEEMSNSAKQELIASIDSREKQLRSDLLSEHAKLIDRFQVEGFAHTLGYVADIRLFLHDVEGALRAGLEQFDAATRSNTNYIAHALDKLTKALEIAIKEKQQVPPDLLDEVQGLLRKYPETTSDPRVIALRRAVESYRTIR